MLLLLLLLLLILFVYEVMVKMRFDITRAPRIQIDITNLEKNGMILKLKAQKWRMANGRQSYHKRRSINAQIKRLKEEEEFQKKKKKTKAETAQTKTTTTTTTTTTRRKRRKGFKKAYTANLQQMQCCLEAAAALLHSCVFAMRILRKMV